MNGVSTLALVCGVLVGVLCAAAFNPLFRPAEAGGDIRAVSSQTTWAPLNGTVLSEDTDSFTMQTSSTTANPSGRIFEMRTDAKTLNHEIRNHSHHYRN